MTDGPDEQGHDSRYCGAKTRAGGRCRRPAGWGTDHAGVPGTTCRLHLGGTRNHRAAAERVAAEEAVAATAARFGVDLDDTPADQIALREIRRGSAMVNHLASLVAQVAEQKPEDLIWGATARRITPAATPNGTAQIVVEQRARIHPWVVMLERERAELRAWMMAAHQAGIRERITRQAEMDGTLLAQLIHAILFDPELDMRPEQRAKFGTVVPRHLRAIDGGQGHG